MRNEVASTAFGTSDINFSPESFQECAWGVFDQNLGMQIQPILGTTCVWFQKVVKEQQISWWQPAKVEENF